ncbi:hypothetical protein PV325_008355 [Microctonus aethiopoides]|uniref:Osiris 10 n=1 Tax=Microctonus aethiopoides TaxID=144406 RepID=A0AA39KKL3_9HYME|nr:hypothetical protein PV325_008355 [Microctonus aethiopoides]KAK0164963.1 hypothetical protein PV328_003526 [Microctonus aethiopoides]
MEPSPVTNESNLNESNDNIDNIPGAIAYCLAKKKSLSFDCINEGSLSVLRSMNDKDHLDFGNIILDRSESESRDLLDLDYNPKDFNNVIKAAARLMERRNMKWDLNNIYPGLQMKVGPMLNGNGILEFVVDERIAGYSNRQLGPGRMLMRSLVLPFLLGFKFSLSSLIPLVFGIILLITKKALFLTKIALMLSGILGWNAFVSSSNVGGISPGISSAFHPHGYNDYGFNHHYGYDHGGINADHHNPYRPYRNPVNSDFPYNQHVIREIVDVYDSNNADTNQDNTMRSGKKFVWTARN